MSREGGHRITSRVSAEEYKPDHVVDSELATTELLSLCLPPLLLHVWIDHVYYLSHSNYNLLGPYIGLFTNAQTSSLYWWTALTQW